MDAMDCHLASHVQSHRDLLSYRLEGLQARVVLMLQKKFNIAGGDICWLGLHSARRYLSSLCGRM